ncbi:MAG TPA: alpha-hydroxy acid oxidase [Candidatus Polarisedimenticolaceae bacterium]|nr:alpha-hydroxy acid oxidase [Candidatus Polarisedimenticolaceae bacterium]
MPDAISRRRLLRFLLASPLATQFAGLWADEGITSAEQALDVFDFETVARQKLSPAHFGYIATGVDGDATLRANSEGFARIGLRVRRLVDLRTIDRSVTLFGTRWDSPIVLSPVASQRGFHADGELATARAARSRKHLQILSTITTTGVEDVVAARGEPVWFQLYPTDQWPIARALLDRAGAAGCPVLVLTVDLQGGSNRVTLSRARRADRQDCATCHAGDPLNILDGLPHKPMFRNLDLSKVKGLLPEDMTWDYLGRLREVWRQRLVVKGIVTKEDAKRAVAHGVDGLIVSNHGGRAEESNRATIDSLPEVLEGVRGRVPVLLDGGIRRGTDVFKALALGATGVCIGRPYIWGLAAFGQRGVEAVLDLLRAELLIAMRQAGTRTVAEIDRSYVVGTPRP